MLHQLLRGIHKLYSKMWINHPPKKEPLITKIFLLWKYNVIIALIVVGITVSYSIFVSSIFPNFGSINSFDLAMVVILFAVLNIVFRISTYGYVKRRNKEEDDRDSVDDEFRVNQITALERKGLFYRAYISFIYSLAIFVFIGIGLTIATGTGLSLVPFNGVNPTQGLIYGSVVLLITWLLSALSEVLLWIGPFSVPEYLSD